MTKSDHVVSVSPSVHMYNCLLYLQGMKMFFLIVVALYILYLIFLVVRARSELKNMPYSGK